MSESIPRAGSGEPAVYQIRIHGHLGPEWREWFGSMSITPTDNGQTLITGPVIDQAALHGLLKKVRDLGTPLLAVNRITPGQNDGAEPTGNEAAPPAIEARPPSDALGLS
jgi:hypothetical protein